VFPDPLKRHRLNLFFHTCPLLALLIARNWRFSQTCELCCHTFRLSLSTFPPDTYRLSLSTFPPDTYRLSLSTFPPDTYRLSLSTFPPDTYRLSLSTFPTHLRTEFFFGEPEFPEKNLGFTDVFQYTFSIQLFALSEDTLYSHVNQRHKNNFVTVLRDVQGRSDLTLSCPADCRCGES
jgi:hypothetical protein